MSFRKGISPLIAAVLLLAFAMAIAGMFSEWSGELFDQTTQQNTERQQQLLDCTGKSISILSIDELYGAGNIEVTLRAEGGKLGNITVTAYPSLNQSYTQLQSDKQVETVTIDANTQQDRIIASAQKCSASSERVLN